LRGIPDRSHRKVDAGHGEITPEYIDYNDNDVLLLQELLEKLRVEFDLHPIDVDPTKALSPAAIAKGYKAAMGVMAPKDKFKDLPKEALAIAMLTYNGGRAACHVRNEPLPSCIAIPYRCIRQCTALWICGATPLLKMFDLSKLVMKSKPFSTALP